MRFILGNRFQRRAEPIKNAVRDCHDYRPSARLGAERRLGEMMAEQPKQTGGGEAPLVSCHRLCHPIIRDGDGSRIGPGGVTKSRKVASLVATGARCVSSKLRGTPPIVLAFAGPPRRVFTRSHQPINSQLLISKEPLSFIHAVANVRQRNLIILQHAGRPKPGRRELSAQGQQPPTMLSPTLSQPRPSARFRRTARVTLQVAALYRGTAKSAEAGNKTTSEPPPCTSAGSRRAPDPGR